MQIKSSVIPNNNGIIKPRLILVVALIVGINLWSTARSAIITNPMHAIIFNQSIAVALARIILYLLISSSGSLEETSPNILKIMQPNNVIDARMAHNELSKMERMAYKIHPKIKCSKMYRKSAFCHLLSKSYDKHIELYSVCKMVLNS